MRFGPGSITKAQFDKALEDIGGLESSLLALQAAHLSLDTYDFPSGPVRDAREAIETIIERAQRRMAGLEGTRATYIAYKDSPKERVKAAIKATRKRGVFVSISEPQWDTGKALASIPEDMPYACVGAADWDYVFEEDGQWARPFGGTRYAALYFSHGGGTGDQVAARTLCEELQSHGVHFEWDGTNGRAVQVGGAPLGD